MAKVSQMQGVSAHLECLRSDGNRRHPSHCIHHIGIGKSRTCTNTNSAMYNRVCNTSKHCDYYEDDRNNK